MKIGMSQMGKFTGLAMLGLLSSTGLAAAQSPATGDPAEKAATASATQAAATTQSFATSFDGDENPLSEGGTWLHTNNTYTKAAKVSGVAHGTQSGSPSQQRANLYDDSYAILSGFSPNQKASGVFQRSSGTIDSSCSHEVEILLRWADSSNGARGYECLINHDGGYAQIMRWNGTYGSFTELAGNSFTGLRSGDRIECQAVGNVITMSINGTKLAEATDGTYATGNPGVGFFRGNCGSNSDVGFTSFEASGSDGAFDETVKPKAPADLTVD